MTFEFEIPNFTQDSTIIQLQAGVTTFFVGANGSGKTRLASQAEFQWGEKAHRISAHRTLSLNPAVAKISERQALNGLRYGYPDTPDQNRAEHRKSQRWGKKAEIALLNDFDYLVQALFADQSNVALETHNAAHARKLKKLKLTHFQKLLAIWKKILPHRTLQVTGDDITVIADGQKPYSAAEMSDGERAVFYMLGQALVAEPNSVLIFDEPELHVHRAILDRIWDEIEAARPDCAFLVITHDLEFSASRPGCKFVIRRYEMPSKWEIEKVPDDTGFNEDIATLILGSRKPILFVEGTGTSLDLAIYRACYPDWTVLPRGPSENVIHAVATMRHNSSLTRITCSGIVDADDYTDEEKDRLASLGVAVLPVSEIENLFLLPDVARAILEIESFKGSDITEKIDALNLAVLDKIKEPGSIEDVVLRYCRRRIDRVLKKIDLEDAVSAIELEENYKNRTASLDVSSIAKASRDRIENAVRDGDMPTLLANFDNKALLALAAKILKSTTKGSFESWLVRTMRDPDSKMFRAAVSKVLPSIRAQ